MAVLALASMMASGGAGAQELGPLKRISGRSPFFQCTADDVAGQPGKNYPNTVIEPDLAINPANPDNILIAMQQDRWSNGGARGLRGEYSLDGGQTFARTSTPGVTFCQNGPWQRSSDPWVTFSPDGTAYFSSLVTFELADPNLFGKNGQLVSRSNDGGKTWGPPITLIEDQPPNSLNDKNSTTADQKDSKFVYAVWDRLTQFTPGAGVADEGGQPAGQDGTAIARARMRRARPMAADTAPPPTPTQVVGPTYFARTTDGGQTWEAARVIFDPGANAQTIGNQIINLPDGSIAAFFTELDDLSAGTPARIGAVFSKDHGATWSASTYAQGVVNMTAVTPNLQQPIRSADVLFSIAVDRNKNVVYLVWEDQRFSGVNEVAWASSPDGGISWSAPVRINQTPRKPLSPLFQQALIPAVTVTEGGTVAVTYFDFRNNATGAKSDATDYWAVFCNPITSKDQCGSGEDWATEVRLTDDSFDLNNAPIAEGHFLGDYMGLKATGQTVYATFTQSPQHNLTDLYLRSITLPSTVAAAN